jgi:hypothetical protein
MLYVSKRCDTGKRNETGTEGTTFGMLAIAFAPEEEE